jgi:hypothetical protein
VEVKRGGQVSKGLGEDVPISVHSGTVQGRMFGIQVSHDKEVFVSSYPLEKVHVDGGSG